MYSAARKGLAGFARKRELFGNSALGEGVRALAGELETGARASSSAVDGTVPLERSYVACAPDKATGRPSIRRRDKFSVSFANEVSTLAHITTRGEHSAALVVDDDKGYYSSSSMEEFVEVGHKLADAARSIIMKYFRSGFQIIDKEDLSMVALAALRRISVYRVDFIQGKPLQRDKNIKEIGQRSDMCPVTIADRETEAAMCSIISQYFPDHAIFGEEGGLTMPEGGSDYVWVLDPIDGTKSFITGKPVFGTLISLLYKGTPVVGIIDQPVLGERWVGVQGQATTLNGRRIKTRSSTALLKDAYLYTTSPHMFSGETEDAFVRVRNTVKIPLYGCDCYAYGLLSSGHVDVIIEHGLKPYDYLALVPVVEGAGGTITNWSGESLKWLPEIGEHSIGVLAAGSRSLHKAALSHLVGERQ